MHLLVKLRVTEINVDRLRRGDDELTPEGLAAATGLNVRTIKSLMAGKVDRVDLTTMNKLIGALRRDRPALNVGDLLEYRPDGDGVVA